MCSIIVTCRSGASSVTKPQSRMHSRPSAHILRLPGCGSACSTGVSSIIVRYALTASFTSWACSCGLHASTRVPSTQFVVRTRRLLHSLTTVGAKTESFRGVEEIDFMKFSAFLASSS